MDILSLREFKVTAELQNVTKAAEALHIAQPALSRTIKNLEEELEVKLFDRKGRNIYLNENGAILLKHVGDILNSIDSCKLELASAKFKSFSALPLNFYAGSVLIPHIAREFHKAYPNIRLQIYRQSSDDSNNGNKGRLSVFSSPTQIEQENTSLLLKERIFAVVPKGSPLAERSHISLSDLSAEAIITCTKDVGIRKDLEYYYRLIGVKPSISFECNDPHVIRKVIFSDSGFSFFPEYSWGKFAPTIDAVKVPVSYPNMVRYIYINWSGSKREKTPIVNLFESFALQFFEDLRSELG